MDWLLVLGTALATVFGSQGVAALYKYYSDKKLGIRAADSTGVTVHSEAADRLIQRLEVRLVEADRRLDRLDERLSTAEDKYQEAVAHINVLEHHIWNGKPPPPPARPKFA